tara:strand:+ start:281 stop:448 length:168 start_codon:yes stop_codon:yes gene_type:complete
MAPAKWSLVTLSLVEMLIDTINIPSPMLLKFPVAVIMTVHSGVRFNALPKEGLAL